MSQLSAIVSLFFVAAAFLTSCYDQPVQGVSAVPTLHFADN